MGIIIRQSIKNSTVSLLGIVISGLSALFIYPLYSELYGLAQFLISTAALLVPFASLGILGSLTKFFPTFKTEDDTNNGFLATTLITLFVIFGVFSIFYLSFSSEIATWLKTHGNSSIIIDEQVLVVLLLLCLLTVLNYIYGNYAANYQRIVIPQFINQFLFRLFLPILIVFASSIGLSNILFSQSIVYFFILQVILQHIYLLYLGVLKITWPNWKFITPDLRKKILSYKLFASFNQLGYVLAFRIDLFMIPLFLDFSHNGIYAIALFISNVIELPARSIIAIADPIISKAWAVGNMKEIENIYKKSTLNLMIPGFAIFSLIWFGFDNITSISSNPEKFALGKYAFLFLGIGKLFDLLTSVNNQIIVYSPKYKYNLLFILLLGLINLVLNYNLIATYGITGAAFASFMAYLVYNTAKLFFIYIQFNLQPFTKEVGKVILIGLGIIAILAILPKISNPFMSVIVDSMVIGLLYFPLIYTLKLSSDFNNLVHVAINKVKSLISKP